MIRLFIVAFLFLNATHLDAMKRPADGDFSQLALKRPYRPQFLSGPVNHRQQADKLVGDDFEALAESLRAHDQHAAPVSTVANNESTTSTSSSPVVPHTTTVVADQAPSLPKTSSPAQEATQLARSSVKEVFAAHKRHGVLGEILGLSETLTLSPEAKKMVHAAIKEYFVAHIERPISSSAQSNFDKATVKYNSLIHQIMDIKDLSQQDREALDNYLQVLLQKLYAHNNVILTSTSTDASESRIVEIIEEESVPSVSPAQEATPVAVVHNENEQPAAPSIFSRVCNFVSSLNPSKFLFTDYDALKQDQLDQIRALKVILRNKLEGGSVDEFDCMTLIIELDSLKEKLKAIINPPALNSTYKTTQVKINVIKDCLTTDELNPTYKFNKKLEELTMKISFLAFEKFISYNDDVPDLQTTISQIQKSIQTDPQEIIQSRINDLEKKINTLDLRDLKKKILLNDIMLMERRLVGDEHASAIKAIKTNIANAKVQRDFIAIEKQIDNIRNIINKK